MAGDKGNLHISVPLTNFALGISNGALIGTEIMKSVPVSKQSDKYFIFGNDSFRVENDYRANGAEASEVLSYSVSNTTYACHKHAQRDIVTEDDRNNADAPIDPDTETTAGIISKLYLGREKYIADLLFNVTTFTGYTAALGAADKWSNYTQSSPVDKVEAARTAIQKKCGMKANTLVLGQEVYDKVRRHPELVALFDKVERGILDEAQIKAAFRVDNLFIGGALYDTAKQGQASVLDFLWGKYALVCYVDATVGIKKPTMGKLFTWKLFNGLTAKVKKYREEKRDADIIEAEIAYDAKVTMASAGYLYSTVIA